MKWQVCDHLCLTGQEKKCSWKQKRKWFYLPRLEGVEEAAPPVWPWALAAFVHSLGTGSCWSPEGRNPLPPLECQRSRDWTGPSRAVCLPQSQT